MNEIVHRKVLGDPVSQEEAELLRLAERQFGEPFKNSMSAWLGGDRTWSGLGDWTVEIGYRGDKPVAVTGFYVRRSEHAWLGWLFVHPEERGTGVGTSMVRAQMRRAAERGYALLYVWCKPDLVPWYERQEFSTDVPEHILAYVPDGRRVLGVLTVLPEQET
jgi:GNAT superfamily N-acetyltransferase